MRTLSTRSLAVLSRFRSRVLATTFCVAVALVGVSLSWPKSAEANYPPMPTPQILELHWRQINGPMHEAYGDTVNCSSNQVQLSGIAGGSSHINSDGTFSIVVFTYGPFPGPAIVTSSGYGQTVEMSITADG